jgi:hypothetical protein
LRTACARTVQLPVSPTRLAEARRRSVSTQRAPSSVVEHVTFNHGVPGSIPGGPNLRSLTLAELRLASQPPLSCDHAEAVTPKLGVKTSAKRRRTSSICERATARQAKRVPLLERLPRCCTRAADLVTHWRLTKRRVCRDQRPSLRGTTVALGRAIPRACVCQWRPVSPCR